MHCRSILRTRIPRSVLWTAFLSLALSFYANHAGDSFAARLKENIDELTVHQQITMTQTTTPPPVSLDAFPAFQCAIDPFGATPNWGTMRSDAKLDRPYCDVGIREFVPLPDYDMTVLTQPLIELNRNLHAAASQDAITAKLYYSTRYMGSHDLDAAEFTEVGHPAIDIRMPKGTPVRAIAGGRVESVLNDPRGLGLHVIIEHRLPSTGERMFSIYGHMDDSIVRRGDDIAVGQTIGAVGSSGNSAVAHVHLQIDRDRGVTPHTPYVPWPGASRAEVARWTVHPMDFIRHY